MTFRLANTLYRLVSAILIVICLVVAWLISASTAGSWLSSLVVFALTSLAVLNVFVVTRGIR